MKNIEILENKELKTENILSLRKKLKQNELNNEIDVIRNYFVDNKIKRGGPLVTAIFNAEQSLIKLTNIDYMHPYINK